jgi:hypothetical protein
MLQYLRFEYSFYVILIWLKNWYSSLGVVTGYELDYRGSISAKGQVSFLEITVSKSALGPFHPPV